MFPRLSCSAGIFAIATILAGAADGPRPTAQPGTPVLDQIVPPGFHRGTATEVTLTGTGLADPLAAWLGAAGRVTLTPGATTGKDSTKIRARIELSADAPLGMHRLRLATAGGLTNFRPICVDALPELAESDGNHSPATAQTAPIPCVMTGRTDPETSDFFKITVTTAQRVSFEVLGRRMGSGLDPILRLRDSAGRELPGAYSDDAPGLQTDARLTYTFATAGDYLIEVCDSTNRGGQDFWYRLRIGDFPCAIAPLPVAARRGSKVAVSFAGTRVDGVAPVEVQTPADPAVEAVSVTPLAANGLPGWPVTLLLSDHDELMAGDGIGTLAQAQRLAPPCGVTGRFVRRAQKDHFSIGAKKGQRFLIAAQTAELMSPAEVYVTVRDGAGADLAHTDPHREPAIDFTAPADGNFFIVVEHLNYTFGPCEVYRLTVTLPGPAFELSLATDGVFVPQGQAALIPVATLVRRDFGGPIELSVIGPAGLSGSVTVPAGVQQLPPAEVREPDAPLLPAPIAQLPIHAAAEMATGAYEIKVMAKAVADGKEIVAFASTKAAVQAQMGGLPFPPREWLRGVGVAVTPKPPFTLAALWERPEAVRGLGNRLVVVATRDAGFDGSIALSPAGMPPGVTATATTIPPGQAAAAMDFRLTDRAGLGTFPFSIVGRTRLGDREYSATLLPPLLLVTPPFDLKIEPNPLAIEAGGKATLTVTALRKGGYAGPIGLELRNLPAQVAAGRATIGPGKISAPIALTAAAAAPLGSRGDVDVLGTAPLGNQQAASPQFTVRVESPPPSLSVKIEPAIVTFKPGGKAKVKVTIERRFFAGPVAVTIEGLPAKVTAAAVTVPPEQSAAEIELTAATDAVVGKADATVTAKAAATGTKNLTVLIEK